MTTGNDWRWTITAAAVVLGIYGLVFLMVPELYIAQASFKTPPRPGVFRFQGGVLLALAIGSWLARGRTEKNGDGNGRSLLFAVVIWGVFAVLYWRLIAKYRPVLF